LTSITTKHPDGHIAEQVKNAQETLGYQKIIVPKIPPGGGGLLPAQCLHEEKWRFYSGTNALSTGYIAGWAS